MHCAPANYYRLHQLLIGHAEEDTANTESTVDGGHTSPTLLLLANSGQINGADMFS